MAQSFCYRPMKPFLPSPYAADYSIMQGAQLRVNNYIDAMNRYLDCLAKEYEDAVGEFSQLVRDWQSAVRQFNLRNSKPLPNPYTVASTRGDPKHYFQ